MHDTDLIQRSAAILAERERLRTKGPRLPVSCRPTGFDAALAIQAETVRHLGKAVGGWKCGTPSAEKLVLAPVHADDIHRVSPCPGYAQDGKLRIEPELAYILSRPLPPRDAAYAPAEVDAAIGAVHLALELIGGRYAAPDEVPFVEHLADRLHNRGLFIGPRMDGFVARSMGTVPLAIKAGDTEMQCEGRHPDGDPMLPLYWLAEFLRERGIGLKEGDAIITGSYLPSFEITAGEPVSIRFGALATLHARFDC